MKEIELINSFGEEVLPRARSLADNGFGYIASDFAYNDAKMRHTANCSFRKGEEVTLHLSVKDKYFRDNIGNNLASFFYIKTDGTEVLIAKDYPYAYPTITLPCDIIGIMVEVATWMDGGKSSTLRLWIWKNAKAIKPKTIKVKPEGDGDFTSLRAAIDSIKDNNDINRYVVELYPGVYNILDEYSDSELTSEDAETTYGKFVGAKIGNGVSLVGIGQRDDIVIRGFLPTTIDSDTRYEISTLNLAGNCRLENLTIYGENIRYCVHDDFGSSTHQPNRRDIINCKFIAPNIGSYTDRNVTYGAGGGNCKTIVMENCDFGDCVVIHTWNSCKRSMYVTLNNCTARAFYLGDYNSGEPQYYQLNNCKGSFINLSKSGGSHEQFVRLTGVGTNDMMVMCESGDTYETGDCVTFQHSEMQVGQMVKLEALNIASTTNIAECFGYVIGNRDGFVIVQTRGYVTSSVVGLYGLSIGGYVGVDASGKMTATASKDNAVGVVKYVEGSNAFIRLY